jgi:putative AdoMet-dependent methyltransferase
VRNVRSRDADRFNHDPWADGYDAKVLDERNPIRTGYAALLAWTVAQARIGPDSVVLDLGVGTGNTVALIPAARRIVGVDVSAKMIERAPAKLSHLADVELVQADLLEIFDRDLPLFDAVVSTYSVHHLDADEKAELFRRIHDVLRPGARAVFGDLMFEDETARAEIAAAWSEDERAQVLISVEEEHPWRIDRAVRDLDAAGLQVVEMQRFSALSWGICCARS